MCFGKIHLTRMTKTEGLTGGDGGKKAFRGSAMVQVGCKKTSLKAGTVGPSAASLSGWWQAGNGHKKDLNMVGVWKRTVNRRDEN